MKGKLCHLMVVGILISFGGKDVLRLLEGEGGLLMGNATSGPWTNFTLLLNLHLPVSFFVVQSKFRVKIRGMYFKRVRV